MQGRADLCRAPGQKNSALPPYSVRGGGVIYKSCMEMANDTMYFSKTFKQSWLFLNNQMACGLFSWPPLKARRRRALSGESMVASLAWMIWFLMSIAVNTLIYMADIRTHLKEDTYEIAPCVVDRVGGRQIKIEKILKCGFYSREVCGKWTDTVHTIWTLCAWEAMQRAGYVICQYFQTKIDCKLSTECQKT